MKKDSLRKAILAVLGVSAMAGYSSQAAAIAPADLGSIASGGSITASSNAPKRAWSDYGTNNNYGWTHTAAFYSIQVGNAADLVAGTRFDVTVDLKQNGTITTVNPDGSTTTTGPMMSPAFSIWTSGANSLISGSAYGNGYGHQWNQVRGPNDGGVGGDPCGTGGDCALGTNGWMGAGGGGNLVSGRDGWIGYANAGYSFTNGDGDKLQGLKAGASNSANVGQYGDGSALTNVNSASPYVNGGFSTLVAADAMLTLQGLKAGYYLIGLGGSCPDNNSNGQNCTAKALQNYQLTLANNGVSAVPVPGAVWLFGSAMAGMIGVGRRRYALNA